MVAVGLLDDAGTAEQLSAETSVVVLRQSLLEGITDGCIGQFDSLGLLVICHVDGEDVERESRHFVADGAVGINGGIGAEMRIDLLRVGQ